MPVAIAKTAIFGDAAAARGRAELVRSFERHSTALTNGSLGLLQFRHGGDPFLEVRPLQKHGRLIEVALGACLSILAAAASGRDSRVDRPGARPAPSSESFACSDETAPPRGRRRVRTGKRADRPGHRSLGLSVSTVPQSRSGIPSPRIRRGTELRRARRCELCERATEFLGKRQSTALGSLNTN